MSEQGPVNALVQNLYGRLPIGGEFQGFFGDCTEYGLLAAWCALDRTHPFTKDELDRLVQEAITAGQVTSPSGAMTAANLAWLCQREELPYVQSSGDAWQTVLGAQGGYGHWPVVVQVANGSLIPGNQGGVNGHAITILAYDGGQQTLTIANGDSVNGTQHGQMDVITFADIRAAQPFAVTEIRLAVPAPPVPPPVDLAGIRADAQAILQKAGG